MKSPLILFVGAALALPAAVYAADPQPTAAPAAKPVNDPSRTICKSEDVPGSLIAKKKVCMTASEWKEKAVRDGQWAEQTTMRNTHGNN